MEPPCHTTSFLHSKTLLRIFESTKSWVNSFDKKNKINKYTKILLNNATLIVITPSALVMHATTAITQEVRPARIWKSDTAVPRILFQVGHTGGNGMVFIVL